MKKESWANLKGTLAVPIGLALALIPFSVLIGWNIVTMILFWLVLIPTLTIYLPTRILKNKNILTESLTGLTIFYATMVFMIYGHYKTDYFQIMILSFVVNIILVSIITLTRRQRTQIQ